MELVPKKIAVVIPKYGFAGGAERFAAELTERISADPRYEMHVFANRWKRYSDRVIFHRVEELAFPKFLTTPSFAWFTNRRIASVGCDLIHSHERIFAADLFTMHGTPHSYWVREVRRKKPSLFDLTTALVEARLVANPRCRRFLAVSELAAQAFKVSYPLQGKRMEVLAPGVDLEKFAGSSDSAKRLEVRARYAVGPKEKLLLFVGMNFELKGLGPLLQGVAKLNPYQGLVKLLVVGKGHEKKYRRLAADLGITDRLLFAGVVSKGIEEIYGAADALAMLSEYDTFGMTVLEAMAAGLPVLVSNRVGAKDLVKDGINGFVVDRSDILAVTSRLQELLTDGRREEMATAAKVEAQRHCWEALVERTKGLYEELLAEQEAGPAGRDETKTQ